MKNHPAMGTKTTTTQITKTVTIAQSSRAAELEQQDQLGQISLASTAHHEQRNTTPLLQ